MLKLKRLSNMFNVYGYWDRVKYRYGFFLFLIRKFIYF